MPAIIHKVRSYSSSKTTECGLDIAFIPGGNLFTRGPVIEGIKRDPDTISSSWMRTTCPRCRGETTIVQKAP